MSNTPRLRAITAKVNGQSIAAEVEPRLLLSDFLRHRLRLTGTHVGCEHGVCGACTVLLNGRSVRSCLAFAVQIDGSEILTIEGLATGEALHPLQEEFSKAHALQCGFCTPGMLTTLTELLRSDPAPEEERIRDAISGNLCRCTGYEAIIRATLAAARAMQPRETDR